MKRAISYARVSTSDQGLSGFGIQAQQTQIETFARERGRRIMKHFTDVHTGMGSASIDDRKGLQEAIELARKTRWPIVIADYDRLGRDARSLLNLLDDLGGLIISASHGEDADRAIVAAEAERAEREGKEISQRTSAKLQALKREGKRLGNPSIKDAQKKSAEARADKAEKRVHELLPVVGRLRKSGVMSPKEIADSLNQDGYRTSRGQLWNKTNIRRTLKRIDELAKPHTQVPAHTDNPMWGTYG